MPIKMPLSASPPPADEDIVVVLCTAPDEETAARLARTLVEEELAACVNVLPGLRSIYRWQGKVSDDGEVLCLMKTRRTLFATLRERIVALHPYEVPEVIALPVVEGSAPYLDWVRASTRPPG
jgi:periplasmic divalent cation tolerance protein